MSKIILYGFDLSPWVRASLLTLNALEQPFEYKHVDLFKGEHMTDEFRKNSPQHTVPTLDDNGFWIWDSQTINAYLVDKYGKNDALYPKDLQQRAVVNQRLFFVASTLFAAYRNIIMPFYKSGIKIVPKTVTEDVIAGYEHLENFLADKTYLTGEHITIADFSNVALISSLHGLVPIDEKKFPKLTAWLARLEKLPYYEKANGKANKEYIEFLKSNLTEIQI